MTVHKSVLLLTKWTVCCREAFQGALQGQGIDPAEELRQKVQSSSIGYKTNVGTRAEAWIERDIIFLKSYMQSFGIQQAMDWAHSSDENMSILLSQAKPGFKLASCAPFAVWFATTQYRCMRLSVFAEMRPGATVISRSE